MLLHKLFRTRKRELPTAPEPDPNGIVEARAQVREAEIRLAEVRARSADIERRAKRAEKIKRENHLGPAFMRVLGDRGE